MIDSDYDYSDNREFYAKLMLSWLFARDSNYLNIICYDDRNITYNGTNVTCPTCGTYRRTHEIIKRFSEVMAFEFENGVVQKYTALGGRVSINHVIKAY